MTDRSRAKVHFGDLHFICVVSQSSSIGSFRTQVQAKLAKKLGRVVEDYPLTLQGCVLDDEDDAESSIRDLDDIWYGPPTELASAPVARTQPTNAVETRVPAQAVPPAASSPPFTCRACGYQFLVASSLSPEDRAAREQRESLGTITLRVKEDGAETFVKVRPHIPMHKVYTAYADRKGHDVLRLRMLFDGWLVEPSDTPCILEMEDQDQLDVFLEQVGDIGSFQLPDPHDPLIALLVRPFCPDAVSPKALSLLHTKAQSLQAATTGGVTWDECGGLLDGAQRSRVCAFMEYVWDRVAEQEGGGRVDMKAVVSAGHLADVLSGASGEGQPHPQPQQAEAEAEAEAEADAVRARARARAEETVSGVLGLHPGSGKLVLRMTRGPTEACIGFHTDSASTTWTCQVRLSPETEYEGGDLLMYTEGRVVCMPRAGGGMSCHRRDVLHGVTSVRRGTRKSLFVVDAASDLGGEGVMVSDAYVRGFMGVLV